MVDPSAAIAYAMAMKTAACLALSGALGILLAREAWAKDLMLKQKTSVSGASNRTAESTQYWTPTMMIVDETGGRMIVDFAAQKLTSLDKEKRTFVTLSFEQMLAQMDAVREEAARRTADYPEDAKAELERMGEAIGNRNSTVEIKPTGKRETIAGYDAEEYSFAGTAARGTLWVSKALPLPLTPESLKAFGKSMEGMKGPNRQFALAMTQAKGIPLRTVLNVALGPQGTTTINEIVEVREVSPPPEMLAVPEGYMPMQLAPAPPAP